MGRKLTFEYDRVGDILFLNVCSPYPEQESEELGDGVVTRLNPRTGEVENLEILSFFSRFLHDKRLEVPVAAVFKRS